MFCSAFKLIMSTASLYEIKFLLLIFFVPRKRFPSLSFSCFSIKQLTLESLTLPGMSHHLYNNIIIGGCQEGRPGDGQLFCALQLPSGVR